MTKVLIGEGGFGAVHMEFDNGIKVAIKTITISDSNKKDVLREIEILSMLKHPNIIQYYKFEENKHDFSIVMEYADGGNLDNAIKPEDGACKLYCVNGHMSMKNGFKTT